MTARAIIFSAPMVRALPDGMKLQTRRVLKLPPVELFAAILSIASRWSKGRALTGAVFEPLRVRVAI